MKCLKPPIQIYQLFMLGLCVYVLVALAVDTFFTLDKEVSKILNYVDTAICILFLLDFIGNLLSQGFTYLKWGWIDFISSIPMIGVLRAGRAIRIFRILRILRGVRSVKRLSTYVLAHRAQGAFAAAALISILMIVFGSIAILEVENDKGANINNAEDALWWSFVTITTVGYGDKYPVTLEGRIVAAVLMTVGVGLFGTFTGFVANWFLRSEDEAEVTDSDDGKTIDDLYAEIVGLKKEIERLKIKR